MRRVYEVIKNGIFKKGTKFYQHKVTVMTQGENDGAKMPDFASSGSYYYSYYSNFEKMYIEDKTKEISLIMLPEVMLG